jgi:hypothetical protein
MVQKITIVKIAGIFFLPLKNCGNFFPAFKKFQINLEKLFKNPFFEKKIQKSKQRPSTVCFCVLSFFELLR